MAGPTKHEIGVGVLVVGSLGLLAWMSLQVGALDGWGVDTLAVEVALPDAAGVEAGAVVKVAGVEVGSVDAVEVEHDVAVLKLSLMAEAGIRNDAVAQVRARSLLGEKYLALMPQSREAPLVEDGGRLERSLPVTELDELVNALGPLVTGPGGEDLSKALNAVAVAINKDPERIDRMLTSAEVSLENLATASASLPGLVDDGHRTLGSIRGAVAEVRPVVRNADRMIADLKPAVRELEPTVKEVKALATDARATVADVQEVVADLEGTGESIQKILDNVGGIDQEAIRRLMREEGVLIRLREKKVPAED